MSQFAINIIYDSKQGVQVANFSPLDGEDVTFGDLVIALAEVLQQIARQLRQQQIVERQVE